jgi:hypothetical protein
MKPRNRLNLVEYVLESTAPVSVFQPASGMRSLFLGPRGLRARWRLLIFVGLLVVLIGGAGASEAIDLTGASEAIALRWLWFSAHTIVRIAIQFMTHEH